MGAWRDASDLMLILLSALRDSLRSYFVSQEQRKPQSDHCVLTCDHSRSAYNERSPKGLQGYLNLISQRAKIEGFIVFDYAHRYKEADQDLQKWVNSGELKVREHRLNGIDKCVEGLLGLFKSANTGKMLVKISEDGAKL